MLYCQSKISINFHVNSTRSGPGLSRGLGSRGHFQPKSLDYKDEGPLPISISFPFLSREQKDHFSPPVLP